MMRRFLMAFLLLSVAAFASNVNNVVFEAAIDPTYHLDTDLQFTTDFDLVVVSGGVVSGNPNDLQSGDTVCSGAVLSVEPTVNAKWATPDFYAVSPYPLCQPSYCPAMIDYSTVNSNRNIKWLYPNTWDTHANFASGNIIGDENQYNELGASNFYAEPVTYSDLPGDFYSNKRGGAAVFCKGTLEVRDGTTVKGTNTLPSTSNLQVTVTGSGSHSISTRLQNVHCFAAIVKHPIDLPNHPLFFRLYYFGGDVPAISSTVGTDSININVGTGTSTCSFHETEVESSGAFVQDRIMLRTRMYNDGPDTINITDVSSDNACYNVYEAPEGPLMCALLGLPSGLCPASNGFDEPITVGSSRDIYVHVERVCSTGCPTLTYSAVSSSGGGVCGGGGTGTCGTRQVSLCGPITCEVEPPGLELGTQEVGDFGVTCYDIGNSQIACVGNNWYWDGLNGGFVLRTNTQALAYTTDPPGSTGQLMYSSGVALCGADVNVTTPIYECEFDPSSAHIEVGDSEYFNMTCYLNGVETPPDSAQYALIDGLSGSTSDESIDGTTYNAPNSPDSGTLQGYGEHVVVSPYVVGAVALAPIQVVNTTGGGNQTNNGGDPNSGTTPYCKIGSGPITVFPGYNGWVDIWCGEYHNESCHDVTWSIDDGTLWGQSEDGTGFTIDGMPGTSGSIWATVNTNDPNHPNEYCWLPYFIGIPDCWEFT